MLFHSNHNVVTVAVKCPFSPFPNRVQINKEQLAQKANDDLLQTDKNERAETAKGRPRSS